MLMGDAARQAGAGDEGDYAALAEVAGPVVRVPADRLDGSYSPRLGGEDGEHVRLLAESGAVLPPITVHRATMRVIDGMHRLRAARLRGQDEVDVVYFDGAEDEAFVQAVRTNTAHGLPLALEDRRCAADRILRSHPRWSDRRIAAVVGLAPSTVRAIRLRSTGRVEQSNTRVGRDGTARRLSAAEGRRTARDLMLSNPAASVREISAMAGISPSTVHDVRERMRAGLDAVPEERRAGRPGPPRPVPTELSAVRSGGALPARRVAPDRPVDAPAATVSDLGRDPALRLNDVGRALLRALSAQALLTDDPKRFAAAVPSHLRTAVAVVARRAGRTWQAFAVCLEAAAAADEKAE
jgi:ParB-like nuclease family protein